MSIRTTVTLDDDVVETLRQESKARGLSFKQTLNEMVRDGRAFRQKIRMERKPFKVKATPFGLKPGLSYDNIEALLSYGEGEDHR